MYLISEQEQREDKRMHSDFLGKLRQLMTLLLGDRRLQGLGYPGIPEDQVIVEMDVMVLVIVGHSDLFQMMMTVMVEMDVKNMNILMPVLVYHGKLFQVLAKILRLTGTSVTKEDSLCSPHCKVLIIAIVMKFLFLIIQSLKSRCNMTHIKLDPGVATFGKPAGGSNAQVKVSLSLSLN